ncbi:hypothetical protein [Moraxella cuniculi]|uniref:Serine/threonine protein kinase n=1 Tax=Moraxella cuniculi TaxID=34061 RepID=A0A3S5EG09_9GAMM|nr:hypothetical protein [Moraxella cuniculi]VEG13761.1 Uncharacterised protein [Moraxella cuniculi]
MNHAQLLAELVATQQGAIARHQLPDQSYVWIRRASRRHSIHKYRLLGFFSRLLGLPLLSPVQNFGGTAAIATEVHRLTQLRQAGVYVPVLLACQDDALMMSDLQSDTLEHKIWQANADEAVRWFEQGIQAITLVHERGQYLSQAFARNIIAGEQIGFIDFEDDPIKVLSLAQCQARDWLCYLQSTAILLNNKGRLNQARQIWQATANSLPAQMRDEIYRTVMPLRWIRHFNHRKFGGDTVKLASLVVLLDKNG